MDCDFSGNDIGNLAVSGEYCSGECAKFSGCTHYSWANGVCYFKSGVACKSNAAYNQYGVCGIIGLPAGVDCTAESYPLERGDLLWSDEFEGTGGPNSTNWIQETGGGGWGNNELQYYTERNANMNGGNLEIVSKRERYGQSKYIMLRIFDFYIF